MFNGSREAAEASKYKNIRFFSVAEVQSSVPLIDLPKPEIHWSMPNSRLSSFHWFSLLNNIIANYVVPRLRHSLWNKLGTWLVVHVKLQFWLDVIMLFRQFWQISICNVSAVRIAKTFDNNTNMKLTTSFPLSLRWCVCYPKVGGTSKGGLKYKFAFVFFSE